jgi:large-conductance mechanosensitive channel
MNWLIIIIVGILAIALIVFLVIRNQKDEKEFEKELDNDYTKPNGEEGNIEIDELRDGMR